MNVLIKRVVWEEFDSATPIVNSAIWLNSKKPPMSINGICSFEMRNVHLSKRHQINITTTAIENRIPDTVMGGIVSTLNLAATAFPAHSTQVSSVSIMAATDILGDSSSFAFRFDVCSDDTFNWLSWCKSILQGENGIWWSQECVHPNPHLGTWLYEDWCCHGAIG